MSITYLLIIVAAVLIGTTFITPRLPNNVIVRVAAAMAYAAIGVQIAWLSGTKPRAQPAASAARPAGDAQIAMIEKDVATNKDYVVLRALKTNFPADYAGIIDHVITMKKRAGNRTPNAYLIFMDQAGIVLNKVLEREEKSLKRATPETLEKFTSLKIAEMTALQKANPLACVRRALMEKIGDISTNTTEDAAINASLVAYLDALGSAQGRKAEFLAPDEKAGSALADALLGMGISADGFEAIKRGSRISGTQATAQCARFLNIWKAAAALPQPLRNSLIGHNFASEMAR